MMKTAALLAFLGLAAADHKNRVVTESPTISPTISPTPFDNTCNSTCLLVEMTDFYGDGWDGVKVYVSSDQVDDEYAPDCTNRVVKMNACPNEDGIYYFSAIHSNDSYIPQNYWEVFWKATSYNCDDSVRAVYTGGYNTSMVWEYSVNEWDLVYHENLWDNEKECDGCGDAKKCKPKPAKKKKPAKKPSNGLMGEHNSNTTKVAKTKPRYGPPAVNTKVTMFDAEGSGWWQNDYMGSSWYIADDRRQKLFFTGTLCDKHHGYCNVCLGDGSYTMRVTGDEGNFTAWDFCGVVGEYAQELTFHVKKGKCIPDAVVALETDCFGSVESDVTLVGNVAISGFTSELYDTSLSTEISQHLAGFVKGWDAHQLNVVATTLDTRALSADSRSLASFTQDVTFEVTFKSEKDFGVDGRGNAGVDALVSTIFDSLNEKLAVADALVQGTTAELLSLEVTSIQYYGAEVLTYSLYSDLDNAEEQGGFPVTEYQGGAIFFGVAVVGFIALVGVMSKGMSRYETLSQDSIHFDNSEVITSEMDSTVSALSEGQSVYAVQETFSSETRL